MDKVLMRHDDVNTLGVILYVNVKDGTHIFKDRECTQPITYDELKEVMFKVSCFGCYRDGVFANTYEKPVIFGITEGMIDFSLSSGWSVSVRNENASQNQPK